MYIHDDLIPNILEGIYNGTTKSNLLENYGLTKIFQKTVREWLIKLRFK